MTFTHFIHSFHDAKPIVSNITTYAGSNKTSLDGRQFTNTITAAPIAIIPSETASSNNSTSSVLFQDGPTTRRTPDQISSLLASISRAHPPPHTTTHWPTSFFPASNDAPQQDGTIFVIPTHDERTYTLLSGTGWVVEGLTTIYTATISHNGMAAITTITQESNTITLFSQPSLSPFDPDPSTTSAASHSGHGSGSGLVTLTTEHLSTCIASNGDRCMCHDNVCLGSMPISTPTHTTTSMTSIATISSTPTATTAHAASLARPPTAAIAAPIAFAGLIALILLLPCILPRLHPRAAAKFNRICPLDDLYRGIAATWAKLKLTRHRNRSIRKRGSSNMSYSINTASPSPRKSFPAAGSESEKQTEIPDASVASADSSYLGSWRLERERKLIDTRQRQLRDGVWGGSPEELQQELARARRVELLRVKEEKELGRWMAGERGSGERSTRGSGSAGPSTPTRGPV